MKTLARIGRHAIAIVTLLIAAFTLALYVNLAFAADVATVWATTPLPIYDNGQWNDIPDHVRSWFKSVRAPNGIPCCDIADGHRTDWEIRGDAFYIPVPWMPPGRDNWIEVPPDAIVYNSGNPVGDAVVWYVESSQFIRCFVPGSGV